MLPVYCMSTYDIFFIIIMEIYSQFYSRERNIDTRSLSRCLHFIFPRRSYEKCRSSIEEETGEIECVNIGMTCH